MQQYLEWYFSRVKNSNQPFDLPPFLSPNISLSLTLSSFHFHSCSFWFHSLSNITWAREECNFSSFFLSLSLSRKSYTESPRAANVFCVSHCVTLCVDDKKKKFPFFFAKCTDTFCVRLNLLSDLLLSHTEGDIL